MGALEAAGATVRRAGRSRASGAAGPPGEPRTIGWAYLAPALVMYGLFALAPFVHSVYLAFFSWDGIGPRAFVGVDNFREIWASPEFREAFVHAFELIAFYSVLPVAIALLLVSVMNRSRIRGLTAFRTVLFLPYIVAPTAVAVIWRWLLAPDGPINTGLNAIGLGALVRPWLGDFTFALPAIGLVGTWVMFGLVLVLLLAGVQKIPAELYEAARIDGAGAWWEFRAVTLPGLRHEIAAVLVLTDGTTTLVPSYLVYRQAFVVGEIGGAAAIGVVLAVLIAVVNVIITRIGGSAS
jgi:raffinose/stachyose/melibiose transport system permease protein